MGTLARKARIAGTIAALVVALLFQATFAAPAEAAGRSGRRQMLHLTNADRSSRERADLEIARRISEYAEKHSREMARQGYLYHSTETQLRGALGNVDWSIAGENVGVGGSLESLEAAFMASKAHRQNILLETFERAAIGIYDDGEYLWITVIFYGS